LADSACSGYRTRQRARRETIHPRASREILGRLRAAMQHHDERERSTVAVGRHVQPVGARALFVGVAPGLETFRDPRAGRRVGARPTGRAVLVDLDERYVDRIVGRRTGHDGTRCRARVARRAVQCALDARRGLEKPPRARQP